MRVHFWSGGVHPIAESFLLDPPPGIEITSNLSRLDFEIYGAGGQVVRARTRLKPFFDNLGYALGIPRVTPVITDAELVHTLSGIIPLCSKPWLASAEMPSSFYGLNDDWAFSPRRRALLRMMLESEKCRRILCFSAATRESLVHLIADGSSDVIDDKAETLYPAVNPARFRLCEGRKDDEFRILFVGNHFFDKGGRELHKAVSLLARDYKVKLVIVANAPAHHSAMFREFVESHQEPWVEWHIGGVPRREIIEKMYPRAHLFVMCSYIDLFGFVFLEAMASGLPVVGCNVYAQKEIIEDGGNGFLVEPPITPFEESMQTRTACAVEKYRKSILDAAIFDQVVVQLKERIAMLIEDEGLWRSMSRRSMELTTSGKFSVQARNKSLVEIYRSSV